MNALSPRSLARFSARHPWQVLVGWIIGVAVLVVVSGVLGPNVTSQIEFTSNEESQVAFDTLEDVRGKEPLYEQIVVQHPTLTVDDPGFASFVEDVQNKVLALAPEHVEFATSYFAGPTAGLDALVSVDRHTTIVQAKLVGDIEDASAHSEALLDTLHEIDGEDSFTVATLGFGSSNTTFEQTAESDLSAETKVLPIALLVLIIVFGAVAAAFVPMILAFVAIFVALSSAYLISQLFPVSFFIQNMVFMIGLALGIDYTLFIVERFREERAQGHSKEQAIEIAGDTATRAVLFSGMTVIISLLGMLLVPTNIFRALGGGAILVAIASVLISLSLLPAVLALLGDRVNLIRPRTAFVFAIVGVPLAMIAGGVISGVIGLPVIAGIVAALAALVLAGYLTRRIVAFGDARDWFGLPLLRAPADTDALRELHADRGFWAGAAHTVMARPWVSVVLAAGLLIALGIPYTRIELGFVGASSLPPDTDAARAFAILDEEFSAGRSLPTEIVVVADDVNAPEVQEAIQRVEGAVIVDKGEFAHAGIELNPSATDGASADGHVYLTTVALPGDSSSPEAIAGLHRLRDEIVPTAFQGVDAKVYVGGQTAFSEDFFSVVDQYTPIVFVLVLGLSFLLLMMVFRSLVVPIKAIIMNLLSVFAAYGMLVLIFQEGFLADALGFQQVPTIEAWVPLFLFMILFGLSMDYHVFLLSRIRERYDNGHENAASVAFGLRSTANIITGAAAIMVVVFGGFALGDLVMFQQFGFGLAFAVLLDATVVRMVLVPATMELLGDRNWYLPSWLTWLPDLRVEGGPTAVGAPIAGGER